MTVFELPSTLRLVHLAEARSALVQACGSSGGGCAPLVLDGRGVTQIDSAGVQLVLAVLAERRAPPARLTAPPEGVMAQAASRLGLDRILHRDGCDLFLPKPGDAA